MDDQQRLREAGYRAVAVLADVQEVAELPGQIRRSVAAAHTELADALGQIHPTKETLMNRDHDEDDFEQMIRDYEEMDQKEYDEFMEAED